MTFFNIHTHSFEKNICGILSCTPDNFCEKHQLYPQSLISLGIHPWNVKNDMSDELCLFEKYVGEESVIAVGECGLDLYADAGTELQENIFVRQIEKSELYRNPVIIHCVKMHNELIRLKKYLHPKMPWIIHGYRGNETITEQLLAHDFYLSYGRNFNLKSLCLTPIDRIFFETDDADISISTVYENAADILQMKQSELCYRIENNFFKVFRRNNI